jgi:hypothetical protein
MGKTSSLWADYRRHFWFTVIGILAVSCLNRLVHEFGRLIWDPGRTGAIDLKIFYEAVQLWFSGAPTYGALPSAVYPPASYLMLWPVLGWLPVPTARVAWAIFSALALVWLVYWVVKESKAEAWHESVLIGFLPVFYATRTGIGNGQLTVFVIPLLIAGTILLHRGTYRNSLFWGVTFIVMALIKPNVSAPFFWIVLFVSVGRRFWPVLLVLLGYGALTLGAAAFQTEGAIALMQQWFQQAAIGAEFGAQTGGYANQNSLLAWLEANTNLNDYPLLSYIGDFELNTPLTLVMLIALGVWIGWHRSIDIWVLLGVCGIIARLWTYHRIYDDMLILLPTIAVFQIYKRSSLYQPGSQATKAQLSLEENFNPFLQKPAWAFQVAGLLFGMAYLAAVMPANLLEVEGIIGMMFQAFQVITWLGLLGFLVYWAWGGHIDRL